MNQENKGKPRVLIAPLDWGLGHATRVIPVIRELRRQECEPVLACAGPTAHLLSQEFPDAEMVLLDGYGIKYSKSRAGLPLKIITQIPKILSIIKKENQWLRDFVLKKKIDAVISDNRYGLYHESIPSIFITHQLLVKTAMGRWADLQLQRLNYKYINRFTECWVPDAENSDESLAGELSHPEKLPQVPVRHIGPLSRFGGGNGVASKDHLLIILSGPEPQRSVLENKLVSQIRFYDGKVSFVRGLPGHGSFIPSVGKIDFYNHLSSGELSELMNDASLVISRSGYSTVMDLAMMRKKSILIPTPGQSEQEYLAEHLSKMKFAFSAKQKDFSLKDTISELGKFEYDLKPTIAGGGLKAAVEGLVLRVRK